MVNENFALLYNPLQQVPDYVNKMETGMIIFIVLLVNNLILYCQKYGTNIICTIISHSITYTDQQFFSNSYGNIMSK